MLRRLLPLLVVLLPGCALFSSPPEDVAAVRLAVAQLDEALERSDALHEKSLRQLRDELRTRWFEAIDQAVLDDLHKAGQDGLTHEEVVAIDAAAAEHRAKALMSIDAAYEAGRDPQIRKDLRAVYATLRTYILTRMSAEEVKLEMLHQVEDWARGAGVLEE